MLHTRRGGRRRSAAIALVLAGAVAGCGEPQPQRDVYSSLADCTRDWNGPAQCEPVRDGRYSNSWYYGPNHYGTAWPSGRPKPSPSAIEALHTPRGTSVARSASSVSRGGFGSTGHSFSSGS
ncbi:MAG: hypothetical protein ACT4P4_17735 [Betaproteobacteria bacterium]